MCREAPNKAPMGLQHTRLVDLMAMFSLCGLVPVRMPKPFSSTVKGLELFNLTQLYGYRYRNSEDLKGWLLTCKPSWTKTSYRPQRKLEQDS